MRASALLLLLLAAGCQGGSGGDGGASATPDPGPDYPRLGLYAGVGSVGFPLLNPDGSFNEETFAAWSRHHQIVCHATPLTDMRRDIIPELKRRNPSIRMIAYVMGAYMWPGSGYAPESYYKHYWTLINGDPGPTPGPGNLYLYWQDGTRCDDILLNVNLAKREPRAGGGWTYTAAESIAELWAQDIVSTGLWRGMFLDVWPSGIAWMETPPSKLFDWARAGYASRDEFLQGWTDGHKAMGDRLRQLAGPDFILIGNAGQPPPGLYASFNGWMRENFPWQNGGSWESNMYRNPGGYFVDGRNMRQPSNQYLFTAADPPSDPYSAHNRRKQRLGLATATLDEGWGVFGDGSANTNPASGGTRYDLWWFDEHAVDTVTGSASSPAARTGWLGRPRGDAYQWTWDTGAPDAVGNPGFEADLAGWTFASFAPAAGVLDRPTSGAPEGSAYARVQVSATGAGYYYVNLACTTGMAVTAWQEYSVTFWAKSNAPRPINVVLQATAGPVLGSLRLPIGPTWQRHQVTFVPTVSAADARVRFDLGETTGEVSLDGIHLQAGASSVYRRDFDRGIVLVNPGQTARTFVLERPYRRILGTVSPEVNDGSTSATVTLQALDAIFLVD